MGPVPVASGLPLREYLLVGLTTAVVTFLLTGLARILALRVGAVAMPIRRGEEVLGCLNVVYLRRAVSTGQAVEQFIPALRRAVHRIETGLVSRAANA